MNAAKLQASTPESAPEYRRVTNVIPEPKPNGQARDPGEKHKSGNARLNKKREDIAVDRRVDIEAAGGETVPRDRILLDERQTRRPLISPRLGAGGLCATPKDMIMDCGRNFNQQDQGRQRGRARKADESRRQARPTRPRPANCPSGQEHRPSIR